MSDPPGGTGTGNAEGRAGSLSVTLGRQSVLTMASLVANGVTRIGASLVVGRAAGPVSLGVFQSGLAGAQLTGLFGPAALGSAASSFVARASADGDRTAVEAVQAHLHLRNLQTIVPVVLVGSLVWSSISGRADVSSSAAFAVLSASFCLYSLTRGMLYGAGLANRAAWWNIATSIIGVIVVGAGVALGARHGLLLVLFSLSYFVFAAANWIRVRPRRLRSALGREIDRFTVFAVLGTLASSGFLDGTMVLASAVGGPEEVGHFSAAFALATPASLIASTAALVLFPLFSGLHAEQSRSARVRVVDLSSRSLAVLAITLFATLVLLRRELVDLLWGETYRSAANVLAPLLFALMLTTLAVPAVNALTTLSRRGVRQTAVSSVAGLGVGVLAWLFLVPQLGTVGVAYGFLAGSVVSSVVPFVLTWRATRQTWLSHATQMCLGIAVLAVLAYGQEALDTGAAADLAGLAGFVFLWLAVTRSEVRLLRITFLRSVMRHQ